MKPLDIFLGILFVIILIAINYLIRLSFMHMYKKTMNNYYELKYQKHINKINAQKNTDLRNQKNQGVR